MQSVLIRANDETFRSPRCALAIHTASDHFRTRQPICQAAFSGEFGNSRDASGQADGAKSRFPKRVARALRLRNSLHVAIQVWREAWRRDCLRDRTAHPTQKEETGGTVS